MKRPGSTAIYIVLCAILSLSLHSAAAAETLTISEGLKIVSEKSRLLSISRSDEQIAEAETRIAFSRMLPGINASASWTALAHQPAALFGPRPVPLSEPDFFAYSISVQQTLFDFRGNASRYDASQSALAVKKHETKRARNLTAIEFVLAYLDLLEQEKLVRVSEQEVETLEAHRKNAGSFFEEGVITRNDLLQAEVKLADARQRLLTARMLRAVQASRLNSILVRPLGSEVVVQDIDNMQDMNVSGMGIDAAWETAEQHRAEIKIADETLKALGFEETARKSEFFPRFFVKGGYDYTENRYQLHEGNWSVTFGLNLNLFSGGATRAELSKFALQRQKLVEQRAKLMDEIRLEVQQYLLKAVTAGQRLQVTDAAAQQAEENLRINRVRYEEGIGTGSDVLDAVALLANAGTNRYKALYDLRKAEAAVLYATGKDLLEVYR